MQQIKDQKTADAFATSWNNLPGGSVYSFEQFEDWLQPLVKEDIENKTILELACGNGSLLVHVTAWNPAFITGVDLGASVKSCFSNMQQTGFKNWEIIQHDLTTFKNDEGYDVVYAIGVLHHLKDPFEGFRSVINNTKPGGKFHCWVYGKEGNAVVILLVERIRKISSRFPWWMTKYLIATPLTVPYFIYANIISKSSMFKNFPLYEYSRWISKRPFLFFRHVAFDQLVTPQTTFFSKDTIQEWLGSFPEIDPSSTYIILRNGNSWKFGGIKRLEPDSK